METNLNEMYMIQDYYSLHKYYIINKPLGVISSKEESNSNDKTIYDLAHSCGYPSNIGLVGRLDKNTSGIILMTDDNRLNRAITFPSDEENEYKEKIYILTVTSLSFYEIDNFSEIENKMSEPLEFINKGSLKSTSKSRVKIIRHFQDEELSKGFPHLGWCLELQISIKEGKHHQVRRMAYRSKYSIISLKRICLCKILTLNKIPNPGDIRWVEYAEIEEIYKGLNLRYNQKDVCGKQFY
jgi:pseudouridine synthase